MHKAGHPGAGDQVLLHRRAAQIDGAMTQAHVLADIRLVKLEGRRLGGVEHLDGVGEHFDLARAQIIVGRALGPATHASGNAQHPLGPGPIGGGKGRFPVRVEHHLQPALAIAKVDKDDTAMVTPPVDPAADFHILIEQGLGDVAAVVGAHWHGFRPLVDKPKPSNVKRWGGGRQA